MVPQIPILFRTLTNTLCHRENRKRIPISYVQAFSFLCSGICLFLCPIFLTHCCWIYKLVATWELGRDLVGVGESKEQASCSLHTDSTHSSLAGASLRSLLQHPVYRQNSLCRHQDYKHAPPHLSFMEVLAIKLRWSFLHSEHFTAEAESPAFSITYSRHL